MPLEERGALLPPHYLSAEVALVASVRRISLGKIAAVLPSEHRWSQPHHQQQAGLCCYLLQLTELKSFGFIFVGLVRPY